MMKEKKSYSIVFVRHGHRDKPHPDGDNGLSPKGLAQVEDLKKDYKKDRLPPSTHFWSSPKKRCTETLKPLSELAKGDFKIEKLLDEQQRSESSEKFQERIGTLIRKAMLIGETIYLCSHGDVIPEAIDLLTGKSIDISKGQAIPVTLSDGEWSLI
jgi:broad specificity phosphatase PhoE